jgi:hypothetical protein
MYVPVSSKQTNEMPPRMVLSTLSECTTRLKGDMLTSSGKTCRGVQEPSGIVDVAPGNRQQGAHLNDAITETLSLCQDSQSAMNIPDTTHPDNETPHTQTNEESQGTSRREWTTDGDEHPSLESHVSSVHWTVETTYSDGSTDGDQLNMSGSQTSA